MFQVSILDIKKAMLIFEKLVSGIILPGEEGELSILDFHQPIISRLKKGVIKIDVEEPVFIKIKEGIVGMNGKKLVVLVEK